MRIKNKIPFFLIFFLILFSTIEINAAIITYGTQLIGYVLILFISYFCYHYINKNNIVFVFFVLLALFFLAIWQYDYLEFKGIFWLNTIRTIFYNL